MQLIASLNLIYLTLIALTNSLLNFTETPKEIDDTNIQNFIDEVTKKKLNAQTFQKNHPSLCISNLKTSDKDHLRIIEYAPKIFSEIRKDLNISIQNLIESLCPKNNYEAIHNFLTGSGKSNSFFFFSDDKQFMIKTLKISEFKILFENNHFIKEYYLHLKRNRDSLLSRFLGVYQIIINNQEPFYFLLTENMIN